MGDPATIGYLSTKMLACEYHELDLPLDPPAARTAYNLWLKPPCLPLEFRRPANLKAREKRAAYGAALGFQRQRGRNPDGYETLPNESWNHCWRLHLFNSDMAGHPVPL